MGVIASIYKGYGIGGCLAYCLAGGKGPDDEKPVILDRSFVEGSSVAALKSSFGQYRKVAGSGQDVWDVPFSWRRHELLDREARIAYMDDWKQAMGLGDCPSVSIEHHDAPLNVNDHLVLLVVNGQGERVHQGWDWTRSNKICGELDAKYGLAPENRTRKPGDGIEVDGPEVGPGGKLALAKLQMESAIDRCKAAGGTWLALDEELRRGGYELVVITHQKGKLAGQVKGIGVRDLVDERAYFDGSELHRKFSYQNLMKHHGLHGEMPGVEHEQPLTIATDAREIGAGSQSGVEPQHAHAAREPVRHARPVESDIQRPRTRQEATPPSLHHTPGSRGDLGGTPGDTRHRGAGRRFAGLLPGDSGGMDGVHARQPVVDGPRVVAPAVQRPEVGGGRQVGSRVPGAGGTGAIQAEPQAGGRLAAANLQVGGDREQGAQAGGPTVGTSVRRGPELGGGADVLNHVGGTLPEPTVPSGGGRGPRGGINPEADAAAQAKEPALGSGSPGHGLHAPGGKGPGVAAEVRTPGGSGLGGDALSEPEGIDPFEGLPAVFHVDEEGRIARENSVREEQAKQEAQERDERERLGRGQAESPAPKNGPEKGH